MRRDFEGRTVVVTGVSRGLGRALMHRLLERGATVVGVVRRHHDVVVSEGVPPERLVLVTADVTDAAALAAAIDGRAIDALIVNAGTKERSGELLDVAAIRRTFETNVFGALESVRAVLPAMLAHRAGQIVFISSLGRWHGMGGTGGYNASKAALSNLAESLRIDLATRGLNGIGVTLVEPGLIRTGMVASKGLQSWLALDPQRAAEIILDGMAVDKRMIRFPWHTTLLTMLLTALPSRIRQTAVAASSRQHPEAR